MTAGGIWRASVKVVYDWMDDRAMSMGAAIAFYTIFSLAPTLLLVIGVAGLVFGEEAARGALFGELEELVGPESAVAMQAMVAEAGRFGRGATAALIGIAALLIGATTVFAELKDALNRIWRIEPPPISSVEWLVRTRVAGLSLIVSIGFLLLVSLVVSTLLTAFGDWLAAVAPGYDILLRVINMAVSIGVVTALFAMIFRFLPDARLPWRDVALGAFVTAVLFTIGKYLIGLYIGTAGIASGYGAAGTFVVILIWVYYSAQIVLFGAEIIKSWLDRKSDRGKPAS
ncbi:MAG TPA: YihY/virulence factor BrkB family protein [Arenibaculum sp.]|nr:YihY/virulence factor BrkB family protein [Arenibaculum sp.]